MITDEVIEKEKMNPHCPCVYIEAPCHPRCSCKNMFSSVGCAFCAGYGSIEQRTNRSNKIAEKLRK